MLEPVKVIVSMLMNPRATLVVLIVMLLALSVIGCSSPATPPVRKNATPQEVVVNFWKDIDSGNYNDAYDLVYMDGLNLSRDQWVENHRETWGVNGSNVNISNFTLFSNTTLDPDTFQGNFNGIESVMVYTDVSYYGHNTSGFTQFAVVNTTEGWKLYGPY